MLPECDSSRAKSTLGEVLKQLKVEPLRDEPIKAISSSKEQVVCSVVLPLADGATLNIDYTFFWQGKLGADEVFDLAPAGERHGGGAAGGSSLAVTARRLR